MGLMQAIRCKFGHHDWGPILGAIGATRHECEQCGKVKRIKVTPPHDPPGSRAQGFAKPG